MYKGLDQENKACTLIHGWNKLKDEDKWKAKRREMAEQEKRNKNKKQKVHAQTEGASAQEGEKRPPS